MLLQFGAALHRADHAAHAEVVRLEDGAGHPDRPGMVGVTAGRHGQSAAQRVVIGLAVVPLQGRRGVEHLKPVERQTIEHGLADAGAEQVVRVRRDGHPAGGVGQTANFGGGHPFERGRQRAAEAQQVAVRRGHLDPGDNQESVDRLAIGPHQSAFHHVTDRIARVVVGDGESVEPGRAGRGNQVLGTAHAVRGEEGMDMEVDTKGHAAAPGARCRVFSFQFSVSSGSGDGVAGVFRVQ